MKKNQILLLLFILFSSNLFSTQAYSGEPATVGNFDVNLYLGRWYEIASIPQWFQKKCVGQTVAEYSLAENQLIKVLNSCDTASGERDTAEGRAYAPDSSVPSRLKVTFVHFIDWIFLLGGDYWVLNLGENYSYSVVGDPSLKYLWILSRQEFMDMKDLKRIEMELRAIGYNTCDVLTSIQKNGFKDRRPLCEVIKNTESTTF